jgi:hypothetical protein
MELEVSEKLGTQVKAIYQLFCVFNFLATTHRLGCDPLLTDLGGGGGNAKPSVRRFLLFQ